MKRIGDQVKEWRLAPERNWSIPELARRVGTSRQNLENLESGAVDVPKYIVPLAVTMGVTTDSLLGRPTLNYAVAEPAARYGPSKRAVMLEQLSEIATNLTGEARHAFADAVSGFIRAGATESYRVMLVALLDSLPPPPRT